jgi:mannosylglycerate synthase
MVFERRRRLGRILVCPNLPPVSLVVFPFKSEDVAVVARNLETAARHDRIDEVWGIAAVEGPVSDSVGEAAKPISDAASTPVRIIPQERIGSYRAGKGDGMNTALRLAAEQGRPRVHFYDADITNFDESWVDGAEAAADRGYGVVRHRFPRASTDAMITWMITRPGFAMLFPRTFLPRLDQPLGGELLLTAVAVDALASSPSVTERSDWGIDTLITHATSILDVGLYEHHVRDGKRHSLYGSLYELRAMALECLDAVASLAGSPGPGPDAIHSADPAGQVPADLKHTVAYDVDRTVSLLIKDWTEEETRLAATLPGGIAENILANTSEPTFAFMDEEAWFEAMSVLLERFTLGDAAWESLAFRLWIARVLSYTANEALAGYDRAIEYLEGTIRDYEKLGGQS